MLSILVAGCRSVSQAISAVPRRRSPQIGDRCAWDERRRAGRWGPVITCERQCNRLRLSKLRMARRTLLRRAATRVCMAATGLATAKARMMAMDCCKKELRKWSEHNNGGFAVGYGQTWLPQSGSNTPVGHLAHHRASGHSTVPHTTPPCTPLHGVPWAYGEVHTCSPAKTVFKVTMCHISLCARLWRHLRIAIDTAALLHVETRSATINHLFDFADLIAQPRHGNAERSCLHPCRPAQPVHALPKPARQIY